MFSRREYFLHKFLLSAAIVAAACFARSAHAGGGPENLFLVVNPNSWASRTVANYFIYLRAVPASHVMMLPWEGPVDDPINVDEFRNKILQPILKEISTRGLEQQIDGIIYSSDFPYEVDTSLDLSNTSVPEDVHPGSSLTGLTYLSQYVLSHKPYYVLRTANRYMRITLPNDPTPPSQAFSARLDFPPTPESREPEVLRYKLSTMLAITSGRGTSVNEAISDLLRSYRADGTHPAGTIYYMRNADVRTKTRSPRFQAAIADLAKLGVRAETLNGILPENKPDVMGLMSGATTYDWSKCGSTILPGAICENFTSTGGRVREGFYSSQTSLAEFLRYGASGTCGTVMEPYAYEQKFPLPSIHVHYARGCTLAESFYQSVGGPYQLLIVGDPLCRPWANIARVGVRGISPQDKVKGTVEIEPFVVPPNTTPPAASAAATTEEPLAEVPAYNVERFELFVDGRQVSQCKPGEKFTWDTTAFSDGFHELRMVSIEASTIATQSRCGVPCFVANQGLECQLSEPAAKTVRRGEPLHLEAACAGATQIDFVFAGGVLGGQPGEKAALDVDTTVLGLGPLSICAVAQHASEPKRFVTSQPVRIEIKPPAALAAIAKPAGATLTPGLLLTLASGDKSIVADTMPNDWLSSRGAQPNQQYTLEGYFDAASEDLYQLQAGFVGKLTVKVDDQVVLEGTSTSVAPLRMVPITLAKGLHHLVVEGESGATAQLELRFGNVGTWRVGKSTFSHIESTPPAAQ